MRGVLGVQLETLWNDQRRVGNSGFGHPDSLRGEKSEVNIIQARRPKDGEAQE